MSGQDENQALEEITTPVTDAPVGDEAPAAGDQPASEEVQGEAPTQEETAPPSGDDGVQGSNGDDTIAGGDQEEPATDTVEAFLKRKHSLTEIPNNTKSMIASINEYTEAMGPGCAMGDKEGGMWQKRLYLAFIGALSVNDEETEIALDALTYLFRQHRSGAFTTSMVFRFMDTVRLSKNEALLFQMLLQLFLETSVPAGRALALKNHDFKRIASKMVDPRHAERLMAYFRVS